MTLNASYMHLWTRVIQSGSPTSTFYGIGQELPRRPGNSGSLSMSVSPKRWWLQTGVVLAELSFLLGAQGGFVALFVGIGPRFCRASMGIGFQTGTCHSALLLEDPNFLDIDRAPGGGRFAGGEADLVGGVVDAFAHVGDRAEEISVLRNLARVQRDLGNLKDASENVQKAIALIESTRQRAGGRQQRSSYLATMQEASLMAEEMGAIQSILKAIAKLVLLELKKK